MATMKCPYCHADAGDVLSSRNEVHPHRERIEPFTVKRRRECAQGHRFTTIERIEWKRSVAPVVGRIEAAR
jgi:transcriptional regulator NrdR family protein